MTKKDPTTKLKALKDFASNLSQLEINEKAVEIFGKLYIQLSMDVENLVRENAQNALMAMIVGDKISSEPVISRIFPYLLISMYDTHAVTATVAQNCFTKMFSSKNVSEILTMCQEDVLENFRKNLTVLNAQTICNTHTYTPEECQAKYERIVIGSLKGYGMYVEKIPTDKLEEFKEQNHNLIQHERFLSLYKSKSPYIKAAFYEAISNLLLHAPGLLKNVETKLAALVFKSIDESDPSISMHVWSCILLTQIKIEKWWTHINIKLFFEKLFMILKSCNNASLIFPNLLPLISNFKSVFYGMQLEVFHANLMKNLHHGLTNENQSERLKSECSSIIIAYYEVLHFIIIQIISDENMSEEEKLNLSNRYIDDYIIATLFWCFNNKKGSFPRKLVYQQIAKVINFFSNNCASNHLYEQLFNRFWVETYQIISNGMKTNQDLKSTSSTHFEFIKNILPPRKKHVRMEIDESLGDDKKCVENQSLRILVQKLCRVYIEKINVTLDVHLLANLKIFIEDYQSTELFQYLLQEFEYKSVYELYGLFESWLKEEMQCESVVEIIVILFKYMSDTEKLKLLSRWNDMKGDQKKWMLLKLLDEPLRADIVVKEFLKSSDVSNYITECAKIASTSGGGGNFNVLRKSFQLTMGNFLVTDETCRFIIDIMCKTTRDSTCTKTLDKCVKFLIDVFPIIICAERKDLQNQVFLAFFECSLREDINDDELLWSMISTWQEAINNGTLKMDEKLLETCISITNEKIGSLQNINSSRLEYIALNISKLLKSIASDDEEILIKLIVQLMGDSEHYKYLYEMCYRLETIHGKVFPRKSINFQFENLIFGRILNDFIKTNLITINVLFMMSCEKVEVLQNENICQQNNYQDDDDDDDDDSEPEIDEDTSLKLFKKMLFEEGSSQKKIKRTIFLNKIIEIAKYETIFKTLKKYSTKLDLKQKEWITYYEEKVKSTLSILNDEDINELLKVAPDCLNLLMQTKKYSGDIKVLFDDSKACCELENNKFGMLESFVDSNEMKILPLTLLRQENFDINFNVAFTRLFIKNHLDATTPSNDVEDAMDIIAFSLNLLNEIIIKQKTTPFLLYKKDLNDDRIEDVLSICSIMNFLCEVIKAFPTKLNEVQWDFLRLALSSWTLTLKRSYEKFSNIKIQAFIISIYKLNAALLSFVELEKTKSSSQLISSVIDEWQAIFSTDVNTILLQVYIDIIVTKNDESSKCQELFMDALCHNVAIDFNGILRLRSSTISLKDCLNFSIKNLRNDNVSVCIVASKFINQVKREILKSDQELLVQNNSKYGDDDVVPSDWHSLELFRETLENCQVIIEEHVDISR